MSSVQDELLHQFTLLLLAAEINFHTASSKLQKIYLFDFWYYGM